MADNEAKSNKPFKQRKSFGKYCDRESIYESFLCVFFWFVCPIMLSDSGQATSNFM